MTRLEYVQVLLNKDQKYGYKRTFKGLNQQLNSFGD